MSDAQVFVSGLQLEGEIHGLEESISEFRMHHQKVGDALLNVSGVGTPDGKPRKPYEPRPAYVYQPWPKMMYHADGREGIAHDEKEKKALESKGWRNVQYPRPQIELNDPKAEKMELKRQLTEKDGQINRLADTVEKLSQRIDDLAAVKN